MNENKDFKPFVPADKTMPEFTVTSILLGVLLAVVFGGANAYLGLRVGMTVSASIPAAVISMGIIRVILKKDSILENNMVQTIGSAGESVAAGAIFTLPALFLWADEWKTAAPSLIEIAIIAFIGGALGILFMVPLRKALIVQEHGTLPYPEGKACAEVLVAGEEGGAKASTVFAGLGISAVYKFIADGLKIFPSEVHYEIPAYKGSGIGMDVLPALLGVGYICGPKISSYLFCGGILGWFVLMPLMVLFGGNITLFPADVSVAELYATKGSMGIWSNYIKYIGAGAVACGGVISLIKSLPLIITTFRDALKGFGKGACVPLSIRLHDGLQAVCGWDGASLPPASHVLKMVGDAYLAAQTFGDCLLLLDRYFLTVPALITLNALNHAGSVRLEIVTKAKKSCTAFEKPAPRKPGRGRPPKKGAAVHLKELFDTHKERFVETQAELYGKQESIRYYCVDLLWVPFISTRTKRSSWYIFCPQSRSTQ